MTRISFEENVRCNDDLLLPIPINSSVHDIIEEHCQDQPTVEAVSAQDGSLTYGDLSRLSSHLAHHLIARGVGLGSCVPLCLTKSRWTPVVVLGVIKTGAAFAFLDQSLPLARLSHMSSVVKGTLILCSPETTHIGVALGLKVMTVTEDLWESSSFSTPSLPVVPSTSPLYIAFTSGSTGSPKGALNEHGAFAISAIGQNRAIGVQKLSRSLQFSAYAFDACVMETLAPLLAGACVCVLGDSQRMDSFLEVAKAHRVTHAILTPSFVRSMPPLSLDCLDRLEVLLFVGEPVTAIDLKCCSNRIKLMSGYGPAECAVVSTVQPDIRGAPVPNDIGYPIAGACWVVDESLQPVAAGITGELLIEGPTVGRGYVDEPEKTAAAFISPPNWLKKIRNGQGRNLYRLYRTGDLGRLVGGSLEYRGRKDHQVKLRGQRMELGDVEHHILQCFELVTEAIAEVISSHNSQGTPYLAAFIVIKINQQGAAVPGTPFAMAGDAFHSLVLEGREKLARALPPYMIPSVFIPVLQMPHTASGKADRRRLRECLLSLSLQQINQCRTRRTDSQPASTSTEKTIQRIWADVLSLPSASIGMEDNFFDLGGDSISAIKVATASRSSGVPLTVGQINSHPTVGELANAENALSSPVSPIIDMKPFSLIGRRPADSFFTQLRTEARFPMDGEVIDMLPLTGYQKCHAIAAEFGYFCFAYDDSINVSRLRTACEAVVAKYSILRTVFVPYNNDLSQAVFDRLELPFKHIKTDQPLDSFTKSLCEEDRKSQPQFAGVPLKFIVISNTESKHTFVIRLSHLQYDGVSMIGLITDLAAAYKNGQLSKPSPDYSTYLYHRAHCGVKKGYDFWGDYLHNAQRTTMSDVSVPLSPTFNLDPFYVSPRSGPLSPPSLPAGISLPSLLMAAWSLTLSQFTKQTDIVFGQASAGRGLPIPEIDSMVGLFFNMIPLRVSMNREWTGLELLHHVQDQHRKANEYDYFDLPDLLRNCTPWPAGTDLDCRFLHQTDKFDVDLPLEGPSSSMKAIEPYFTSERHVWGVTCLRNGRLDLCVMVPNLPDMISKATQLVERYSELVKLISACPEQCISVLLH